MNAVAPSMHVGCRVCTIRLEALCYRRAWWFRAFREVLATAVRVFACIHRIRPTDYRTRSRSCHGCLRFTKNALKERSTLFRKLDARINPMFNRVRDALLTELELEEARRFAMEAAHCTVGPRDRDCAQDAAVATIQVEQTIAWTHCASCGSAVLRSLGERRTCEAKLHVALCEGCGLVFVNPMLTDAAKAKLQPSVGRLHRSRSAELSDERALRRSRRRAARWEYVIKSQLTRGSRVLEVGAGDGALTELLLTHGHQPVALDPDQEACQFVRQRFGITAIPARIEDVRLEALGTFDAVFMLNLIEHLENPAAVLSQLGHSLKDGGILAIETPNILRTKVGPRRMFSLPHNYYFSPLSLLHLLARQGFHSIHCRTFRLDMFHLTARRWATAIPSLPDTTGNAAAVDHAISTHAWQYYLRGQFLLRKLPWFREWYLYGRHQDHGAGDAGIVSRTSLQT